jgi:dihydropyrimidine dehydrogenase (NAD+) subunit PreT
LETVDGGKIVVDAHGQCSNPKYFAGGDAVNGGAEVVNAAAEGKLAAKGIHAVLFK